MRGLNYMEKQQIEDKVAELLTKVNYHDKGEAVDIIQIAKDLGFAVGNAVLTDDDDGFIIVKEGEKEILGIKTDKLIGVNSERPLEWKRFIVAHEIAHYFLHYCSEKNNGMYAHRDHRKGKNEAENEADYFAACLLMPEKSFIEKFKELKEKDLLLEEIVLLLAKKFVATPRMTERRVEELGLNG